MKIILEAVNIKKKIKQELILKGINLKVYKGEFLSIIGASGSGKSTLLYILGLLDKPTGGNIILEGENIDFKNVKKLTVLRNKKFGFVFQFHYLIPEFTAVENVIIPMLKAKTNKKQALQRATNLLKQLGLTEKINKRPFELSGGEQQRVAIARALANKPSIILADEPTGNLDSKNTQNVMEILLNLNNKYKTTIIMVTHELELAKLTDRTIELVDGKITKEIINKPDKYTHVQN